MRPVSSATARIPPAKPDHDRGCPADQGLEAEDATGVGRDDRLVSHLELRRPHGALKAILQRKPVLGGGIYGDVVEPVAVSPFALGGIEGQVGVAHQRASLAAAPCVATPMEALT